MTADPVAIVPVRSFDGMSRLAATIDRDARSDLARRLAIATVDAAVAAGMSVIVVSSDSAVRATLVQRGATFIDDPGSGLDRAAAAGVEAAGGHPWLVVHADLPLVTAGVLRIAAARVRGGATVLVPSLDGGTNLVGGRGVFDFSFGPGSFHRHLAAHPGASVLVDRRLTIDLDTPLQLAALGGRIPVP